MEAVDCVASSSSADSSSEQTDRPFGFPFEPYLIQRQLMTALYATLESKRVGIFESPTGTGKSLSLLCACVTWLQDDERRRKVELERRLTAVREQLAECKEDDDWLNAYDRQLVLEETSRTLEAESDAAKLLSSRLDDLSTLRRRGTVTLKERQNTYFGGQKRKNDETTPGVELADDSMKEDDDEDIAPMLEYNSDGEGSVDKRATGDDGGQ